MNITGKTRLLVRHVNDDHGEELDLAAMLALRRKLDEKIHANRERDISIISLIAAAHPILQQIIP